jgi:pimeloyl-ACP methyl ester carboxylesterase
MEYVCTGEGYPVLVVHGALGGFDQGLWLSRNLDASQYQSICVSRFGFLRSPLPPGANLNMQADAFASLLDILKIHRLVVLGVSSGATSAIRFTARHPERVSALVLYGPDAPGEIYMAIPPRFVFDTLLRSDFVYWVLITFFWKQVQEGMGLAPKGYPLTPEQAALLKQIQKGDLPVSPRMDGMIFETYTCDADFRASVTPASPYPLNKIETPVLVISAADDPISLPENVRHLANQMPNARLFVVPDGGHFCFGHVEEVKVEIARFLREQVLQKTVST